MGCARSYVTLVNTLLLLLGAGVGVLVALTLMESPATLRVGVDSGPFLSVALAVIMIVVGGLGCFRNKGAMFLYLILLLAITGVVAALGIMLLQQASLLEEILGPTELADIGQSKLNDLTLKLFTACCVDAGITDVTVPPCVEGGPVVCIADQTYYDAVLVPGVVCQGLDAAGTIIAACQAGPGQFWTAFMDFLSANTLIAGISLMVSAVLLLFADLCACVLLATEETEPEFKPEYMY